MISDTKQQYFINSGAVYASMSERTAAESIRFATDELAYVEAGRDFPARMRPYDAAVTGRIQPFVGDSRLFVGDVAPATFDVSETVDAMYSLLEEFESAETVRARPFCCACGASACAYIRWRLERLERGSGPESPPERGPLVRLTIETLAGDPIGAHRYDLSLSGLRTAVADLADDVAATLEAAGTSATHAGTVDDFRGWAQRLRTSTSEESEARSAETEGEPSTGGF